jgi:cell division protein FtsL
MVCAQQAMGWVQLKNEHSKIKDIVENLTSENAELKQNVTELSNENDKLMDVIHKNRWLIVF